MQKKAIITLLILVIALALSVNNPSKANGNRVDKTKKTPANVKPSIKANPKTKIGSKTTLEQYEKDKRAGKPVKTNIPPGFNLKKMGTSHASAYVEYLKNLTQVTGAVDAIIVGTPTVAFESRDHYTTYTSISSTDSILDSTCSIGPFLVDRVLYQKPGNSLLAGQTISLSEETSIIPNNGGFTRIMLEKCTELKQNSKYVVFVFKSSFMNYSSLYSTCNLELGRFNTDGTDYDDEVGGRQWKEGLRQQLTAAYGVAFVVPSPVRSVYARINGGGAPRPPGLPPPPPPTGSITCTISAPQPTGMRLQIEQEASRGGSWSNIADIALTASAQTSSEPVSQTVDFPNGVLRGGARIRARLINGAQPSPWSTPTTVQLPI